MIGFKKVLSGWISPLFFVAYLAIGLSIVSDYGISWDEPLQRRHGQLSVDHIIDRFGLEWKKSNDIIALRSAPGRQYAVLFSATCDLLDRALGITKEFRKSYLLRHTLNFLIFWLSSIFFYKILVKRFEHKGFALLGTLFLILSPRIFAHSFYNPKDLILLAFYIISSYTMIRYLETRGIKQAFAHALATALVINARMPGVIIPALSLLFVFLDLLQHRFGKDVYMAYVKSMPVYLVLAALLTILFFPYLWLKPVANSVESFQLMAHFPFGSDILYQGEFIKSWDRPWHYIPVWMGITIPPLYLLFFVGGFFLVVKQLWPQLRQLRFWNSANSRCDLFFLGLFAGPITIVYLLDSNLYDGWRQLFFVYPAFLYLGMIALKRILASSSKYLQYGTWLCVVLSLSTTLIFMIKNHPHQQVYFNFLAGKNIHERFEMDYWGVSYKQAFEQLIALHPGDVPIHVYCANEPCYQNYKFLAEEIKSKIRIRWGDDVAEYMLSNFRFRKEHDRLTKGEYPYQQAVDFIKVDGEKLIGIFKLREEPVIR